MNKKDMFYLAHFEQYSLDKNDDTGNINRGPLLTVAENQKAFEKAFPDLCSVQKGLSKKDYIRFLYNIYSFEPVVSVLLDFYREVISDIAKNNIHGAFNKGGLSLKETQENCYYNKLLKRIEATIYCLVMEDDLINNHLDDEELVKTVKEADDD